MAGVSSPYSGFTGREYDYGPGIGLQFEASFMRNGWSWLSLRNDSYAINTVNGPDSEHFITMTRVRAIAPLVNDIGLGLEYSIAHTEHKYADYPDLTTRTPQARIFASWGLDYPGGSRQEHAHRNPRPVGIACQDGLRVFPPMNLYTSRPARRR